MLAFNFLRRGLPLGPGPFNMLGMNPGLEHLKQYPFARLDAALGDLSPPVGVASLDLSIGEPQGGTPGFITRALGEALHHVGSYPSTVGMPELRQAQAGWLARRCGVELDPGSQVLPVNGSREALFAFAQCVVDRAPDAVVCMANPYYQIYEGAAILAGAGCHFVPRLEGSGFAPDYDGVDVEVWQRCQLLYVCSPDNPTGHCLDLDQFSMLLGLAERHDFVIAADECYLDIYPDEGKPPAGVLQLCRELGNGDYSRVLSFQSLSKRSGAPGLRSGFVAGDAELVRRFLLYRTYHGSAMPLPTQHASMAAWGDDRHAAEHRQAYRERFEAVLPLLQRDFGCRQPGGGFYIWAKVPGNDLEFAKRLYADCNLKVLPGRLLSEPDDDSGPGAGWIRMALVAGREDCLRAADCMLRCL